MISFLRYLTLLREGGWSNAITQDTIIHPPLIRKILIEIKKNFKFLTIKFLFSIIFLIIIFFSFFILKYKFLEIIIISYFFFIKPKT